MQPRQDHKTIFIPKIFNYIYYVIPNECNTIFFYISVFTFLKKNHKKSEFRCSDPSTFDNPSL